MIEAGKDFKIPPWEVEERTPILWWNRWIMYRKCVVFAKDGDDSIFGEDEEGE